MKPNTRIGDLHAALPAGYSVHTYSPGDGVTRYRFFRDAPPSQTYFGPANGIFTALGYKEAITFARGLVAHTPNAKSKTSDKINVDQIAKLFDLPGYEDLHEQNIDYIFEAGDAARDAALADDASEEEADEASMKGQEEADTELFHQWHSAVMAAADQLFEKHGLTLVPVGIRSRTSYPYEYKVVPDESWEKALKAIIETINGVGMFHFSSVREFLDSGPYTVREGVLTHLHHIAMYPEVYGDTSAQRIYERHFR